MDLHVVLPGWGAPIGLHDISINMNDQIDYRYLLDREAKRFLRAVEYYGGTATTTEIRQRTGLSRSETNYRFSRLDDLGLISVGYAENGYGERDPPKVAELTGTARAAIERGLLGNIDIPDKDDTEDYIAELRELRETVEQIESRLDVLTDSFDRIETDLVDLEEFVFLVDEYYLEQVLALKRAVRSLDEEPDSYLDDICLENYL